MQTQALGLRPCVNMGAVQYRIYVSLEELHNTWIWSSWMRWAQRKRQHGRFRVFMLSPPSVLQALTMPPTYWFTHHLLRNKHQNVCWRNIAQMTMVFPSSILIPTEKQHIVLYWVLALLCYRIINIDLVNLPSALSFRPHEMKLYMIMDISKLS